MRTHTSRVWSVLTLLLVATFAASFGLTRPAVAKQGPDNDRPAKTTDAGATKPAPAWLAAAKRGGLVSYAEPRETLANTLARQQLGASASQPELEAAAAKLLQDWKNRNYHGPDIKAYQKLLRNEQRALASGSSPAALGLAVTGTLRLFAVAVEFAGTDSATDFSHPVSVDDRTCITETLTLSGPLHNQIPPPGPRDNFSFWRPSFERADYEKLVFSTEGITERVRLDLTDPEDGKPGISIAGSTMRNYYNEVSGGRVRFDGGPKGVIAWIQLPHSEAYYGASACDGGEAGDIASMEGLPSNPEFGFGPRQLIADLTTAINTADPAFPWKDYDTTGDGYIDHVVIFHAGKDKSAGGGQQGYQAIWAHRSSVPGDNPDTPTIENTKYIASNGGTPDNPADDVRFAGYTMQYEDVETGVLVHEFGHDLGLPDLYDTTRGGESSVVWWDLMSTGSNTGKLIGTIPSHMSAWSKYALGWTDPQVITPTLTTQDVRLGQTSRPPAGTTQSVRVDLPPTELVYTDPSQSSDPSSTLAWWTNNDANLAEVTLTRDVALGSQTAPISVSYDIDFEIEEDWDYLFMEVSDNGGTSYTSLPGYLVDATETTTVTVGGPNYSDPNGNLKRFGGGNAFTGSSGGWLRVYHDLSAYAGKAVKLRFRYNTDDAFLERGAFIDNLAITSGATTIFSDPIEAPNGWTTAVKSGVGELPSAGWVLSNGTRLAPKYYLLEWRNADGFDKALLYTYNTILAEITADGRDEFRVDRVPSNVPGMVVYVRDTRYGSDPFGADNAILNVNGQFSDPPSDGPKGGLLVVDANFKPLRGPRNGQITTGQGTFPFEPFNNWSGRVQTTNAAFGLNNTPTITLTAATGTATAATTILTPTRYAPLPPVLGFHDALGYFPGVEQLATPVQSIPNRARIYAFSDPDASAVVPAKGYYPPRTPPGFTGVTQGSSVSNFETIIGTNDGPVNYNVGDAGDTNVTGEQSGNPGDYGVQYGNHFEVVSQSASGDYGVIRISNAERAANISGSINASLGAGKPVTVTVNIENTGGPAVLTAYSDFDESQATYVEGSATNGAVPVRASYAQLQAALKDGGVAAVRALAVQPGLATAVVWTSPSALPSGAKASFSYALLRKPGYQNVRVTNTLFGTSYPAAPQAVNQFGALVYLPVAAR